MALTLPTVFSQDIEGQDTHLSPLVVIGTRDNGSWVGTPIYITAEYKKWDSTIHSYPLLLNIPSIKESIDLQTRKYKISSVSLQLSNVEYAGKRLSERFSGSMLNTEVRIFWYSPNTRSLQFVDSVEGGSYERNSTFQVYYGKIRRYEHSSKKVTLTVEDKSQEVVHKDLPLDENYLNQSDVHEKYLGKPIPIAYGWIQRSPCVFKNGITTPVASNDFVYFLDSPVCKNKFYSTYPEVNIPENYSPLWIFTGEHYININQYNSEGRQQIRFENIVDGQANAIKLIADGIVASEDESEPLLLSCYDFSTDFTFTLSNVLEDDQLQTKDFDSPEGSFSKSVNQRKINGGFEDNFIAWSGRRNQTLDVWGMGNQGNSRDYVQEDIVLFYDSDNNGFAIDFRTAMRAATFSGENVNTYDTVALEFLLLKISFDLFPSNYDIHSAKVHSIMINDINLAKLCPYWKTSGQDQYWTAIISGYHQIDHMDTVINQLDPSLDDGVSGASEYYEGQNTPSEWDAEAPEVFDVFNFVSSKANTNALGSNNPDAAFQININPHNEFNGIYYDLQATLNLDGDDSNGVEPSNVKKIELLREVVTEDAIKFDFFANGRGLQPSGGAAGVMLDIAKRYLNIDTDFNTDNLSDAYTDFYKSFRSFSVNEKINSKKLLEDLAESSTFIPRFDSMGTFKIGEIPFNGGTEWSNILDPKPELAGHKINANSVIDFSFTKTRPEDVYTRIDIRYGFDYAKKEFLYNTKDLLALNGNITGNTNINVQWADQSSIDILDGYEYSYYGLSNDSNSTLTFESKYIRTPLVAMNFATWLLTWYCNQKLIIKLKLPLKYLNIEVSDYLHFDELLGGIKPYGIDYTAYDDLYLPFPQTSYGNSLMFKYGTRVNGQIFTPMFMVTSTNKKLDSVEVECMQLPTLFPYSFETYHYDELESVGGTGEAVTSGGINGELSKNINTNIIDFSFRGSYGNFGHSICNFPNKFVRVDQWKLNPSLKDGVMYIQNIRARISPTIIQKGYEDINNDGWNNVQSIELSIESSDNIDLLLKPIKVNLSSSVGKNHKTVKFSDEPVSVFRVKDLTRRDEFVLTFVFKIIDNYDIESREEIKYYFTYEVCTREGDVNGDGKIDLLDVVELSDHIFDGKDIAYPCAAGNADIDSLIELADKVINNG